MSKLQSDISTMISEDDYRRFVQPFIREQCQKIDYTLYHLDGVGAMHHLPALLEIEELNAIQWTPGVGEPQGGSPNGTTFTRRSLPEAKYHGLLGNLGRTETLAGQYRCGRCTSGNGLP